MGCYKRRYFLHEWAREVSDLHGVKHIARDGGLLRRLIWTTATLAALIYFLYQSVITVTAYFEWHHVVKVDIKFVTEIQFPAFTFCNFNKYRNSALTYHDIKNVGYYLGKFLRDLLLLVIWYRGLPHPHPHPPNK